jgi:hypothetical protein
VTKRDAGLLALGVLGIDELDGDPRAEARMPPLPHRAHAAATDEIEDFVLAGDEAATGGVAALISGTFTLDESPRSR